MTSLFHTARFTLTRESEQTLATSALARPATQGAISPAPYPHKLPPSCTVVHNRVQDPENDASTRESHELLLRGAHTPDELVVVAAVIELTVAAEPPAASASIDSVIHNAELYGVDQWEARVAIAQLDRRRVLRLDDQNGEVRVSLRSLVIAEVMA